MNVFKAKTGAVVPPPSKESPMTKETIGAIIDSVEQDPLAGFGAYTKREILIDRLLAHCRTVRPEASATKVSAIMDGLDIPPVKQADAA